MKIFLGITVSASLANLSTQVKWSSGEKLIPKEQNYKPGIFSKETKLQTWFFFFYLIRASSYQMVSTSLHTLVVGYTVHAENHSGCSRVSFADILRSHSQWLFSLSFSSSSCIFFNSQKEKKNACIEFKSLKYDRAIEKTNKLNTNLWLVA